MSSAPIAITGEFTVATLAFNCMPDLPQVLDYFAVLDDFLKGVQAYIANRDIHSGTGIDIPVSTNCA